MLKEVKTISNMTLGKHINHLQNIFTYFFINLKCQGVTQFFFFSG